MNQLNDFFNNLAEKIHMPAFFCRNTLIISNMFLLCLLVVMVIALVLVITLIPTKKKKKTAEETEETVPAEDAAPVIENVEVVADATEEKKD